MPGIKHTIEPKVQQSLQLRQYLKIKQILVAKVLSLSTHQLRESVATEQRTNPLVETYDPNAPEGTKPREEFTENWEEWINQDELPNYDRELIPEHWQPEREVEDSPDKKFLDALRLELDEEEFDVAEYIFEQLDEDYFLTETVEAVADALGARDYYVEDVLHKMQRIEPYGIASRSVAEYYLVQLEHLDPRNRLAEKIVKDYFQAFKTKNHKAICEKEKYTVKDVKEAFAVIRRLSVKPSVNMAYELQPKYAEPDAKIEKEGDAFKVVLLNNDIPHIRVNASRYNYLKKNGKIPDEVKRYLEKLKERINWIEQALKTRRENMQKMLDYIVETQKDFLEQGKFYIKPLNTIDVGKALHIHNSTISRMIKDKFILTHKGDLLPVKDFLSRKVKSTNGEDVATIYAQKTLHEIIESEDKTRPYSDEKLAALLEEKGIKIKRRTVAKYRGLLNLPGKNDRREK